MSRHRHRRWMASTVAEAFSVDPDALSHAIQLMDEFVRHTESVVSEIDSLITHLHGTWSGEAATAHAAAHRHWAHGEATMREALKALKTAGNTAHHNYTGVMAANAAMWS
jgi:WXG100 family type VII secretion target